MTLCLIWIEREYSPGTPRTRFTMAQSSTCSIHEAYQALTPGLHTKMAVNHANPCKPRAKHHQALTHAALHQVP